jgi:NitT/TauT family transport system substrate-binding protein
MGIETDNQVGARGHGRRRWPLGRPLHYVAAATVALSLVTAACSSSTSAPATSVAGSSGFLPANLKGAAPASVKIGLAGGYLVNYLPAIVALGAGYYNQVDTRFNTVISFDPQAGGVQAEPAFLGGTDQFVITTPATYIPPSLQGEDQVAVFNQGVGLGLVFSAPAKYQTSRGKNIAKYSPGTWCETGLNGSSNAAILLVAGVNKLNLSNLNVTNIVSPAAVLPSIQSGRCDMVSADSNSAAQGILQNISYVPVNTVDPSVSIPLIGEVLGVPLTTSNKFINQYPQLAQAIIDATLKGLLFVQQNAHNPTALYKALPPEMTSGLTEPIFTKALSLFQQAYTAKYNSGTFTAQMINDTISFDKATKQVPLTAQANPSKLFTNKLVLQAYTDLGLTPATGSPVGPKTIPTSVGKTTSEAAAAFGILTGQQPPPNNGPSKLISAPSSS